MQEASHAEVHEDRGVARMRHQPSVPSRAPEPAALQPARRAAPQHRGIEQLDGEDAMAGGIPVEVALEALDVR